MIEIKLLGRADGHVLDKVSADVFDYEIDPRWTAEFFEDPRHHIIVAVDAGLVIGMVTSFHYVHPDKPPQMFINELGVALSHRRRGIARSLMQAMLRHARTLGCTEAWVGTEDENVEARGLYESLSSPGEHFFLYTLEIPPPEPPLERQIPEK